MKDKKRTLNIIGAGKVGKTLGRLWHDNGFFEIQSVLNTSLQSGQDSVAFIGAGEAVTNLDDLHPANVYMIAVGDDQIEDAAKNLGAHHSFQSSAVAFHCSGSQSSDLLSVLASKDVLTASLHPLNSFPDPAQAVKTFAGTWCGLEGHPDAVELLSNAVQVIDGQVFTLQSDKKIFYHAAAVFAGNYLTALMDVAFKCAEEAGLSPDETRAVLRPLVEETVRNNFETSPPGALTGPIARGNAKLVEKQYKALKDWRPDFAALYAVLGIQTAEISRSKGKTSIEEIEKIKKILEG